MRSTERAPRDFYDDIYGRNGGYHAKLHENLRQEVLGCSCECRTRPNDDLSRARQGVVQPCAHEQATRLSKRMQSRAGQGKEGLAYLFEDGSLVAEVVGRGYSRRRGCGVQKHH